MHKWLSGLNVLCVFLLGTLTLWAQNDGFEPSPYIFKITAANCETEPKQRVQTGFQVKDKIGLYTALHGVVGCTIIFAEAGDNGSNYRDIIIGKVDIQNDVAVLWSQELGIAPQVGLETARQTIEIDPKATYHVIGYPLDLFRQKTMVDVRILERTELGNLLPNEAIPDITERDSPAIDAKVFSIQAHLVPGHSGAPLLNQNDEVVGVGNGGLDLGRVEMGWAIPWNEIDLKAVSVKVSQTVSWSDVRKLSELSKSESGLAFSYNNMPETPTPSPTAKPPSIATPTVRTASCPFWLQIIDANLIPIRGAQVKVIYGLESVEDFSNSDGEVRGEIPCDKPNQLVTLEVIAENFESIEKDIKLITNRVKIKLSKIPEAVVTPIPLVPTPANAFEEEQIALNKLIFCYEHEFQQQSKRCGISRNEFSGIMKIVYVSWVPSIEYRWALFRRTWFLDGIEFLTSENYNHYAYLTVENRNSLKPGNYTVQLYANGTMIHQNNFTIK